MSAVLIISILLLGLATYAFLRSKRSTSTEDPTGYLPPSPPPRTLFEPATVEPPQLADARNARRELVERAARGDVQTLREAHATGDAHFYNEVLDALVGHSEAAGKDSLKLVSREVVAGDGLRANRGFALALLALWRESAPDATMFETADLLRVAALSDDAATFGEVCEAVFGPWREGRLRSASAEELAALFENEYWILSPDARRSGAGFVLKRTLAELRRALSDESRRESPTVR